MPIAGRKPTAAPVVKPQLPKVQAPEVKSIIVDNKDTPILSLVAHVAGAPWSVDYYSQVVAEHNDLREIDPGQSAVYQQYSLTQGMELRVSQALSSTYDSENGITTVRGTALVYPFITPNVADYFISQTADGEYGLYRVIEVDRKSFNKDSVYSIDYELVGYESQKTQLFKDLKDKTIRQYRFSKDRLLQGAAPILREEEYARVLDLSKQSSEMIQYYFQSFYDHKAKSLMLPGQVYSVHDSLVLQFLLSILETQESPILSSLRLCNLGSDNITEQNQLWKILLDRNPQELKSCCSSMGLAHKTTFPDNPYVRSLRYSSIDYFVYPDDPDSTLHSQAPKIMSTLQLAATQPARGSVYSAQDNTYVKAAQSFELIKPVSVKTSYVFSPAFYQNEPALSVLEILTRDYLQDRTLDLDMLSALIAKYRSWPRMDQFYYMPVLILLCKAARKAQYS